MIARAFRDIWFSNCTRLRLVQFWELSKHHSCPYITKCTRVHTIFYTYYTKACQRDHLDRPEDVVLPCIISCPLNIFKCEYHRKAKASDLFLFQISMNACQQMTACNVASTLRDLTTVLATSLLKQILLTGENVKVIEIYSSTIADVSPINASYYLYYIKSVQRTLRE